MDELNDLILNATACVDEQYFYLPIYDGDSVYRERVYCYELYHQMRSIWPRQCRYALNGEIDKRGHEFLHGLDADNAIPDFLVHVPGAMDNFAIIEVKNSLVRKGVEKDLKTLDVFVQSVEYRRAIYLIYGNEADATAFEKIEKVAIDKFESISPIEIWLHSEPHSPARHVGTLSF